MKHSAPAISTPGIASGRITRRKQRAGAAPMLAAASSSRGSIPSNTLCKVRMVKGRLIEMMPTITAVSVYIRSRPCMPNSAPMTMSSMPPRANRIIQPAVRVTEPMNSGRMIAIT